jgi:hypothetical protein
MYLIFGGECFYASGGANDFIESHSNKGAAISRAKEIIGMKALTKDGCGYEVCWSHVYDVNANSVIYKSDIKPHADSDGIIKLINGDK